MLHYYHYCGGGSADDDAQWASRGGAWLSLLRQAMNDLNARAWIADCREARTPIDPQDGARRPPPPQADYFGFDPQDASSVNANAPAVCKCIAYVHRKAREARVATPAMEDLPRAILDCQDHHIQEYLEDCRKGRG
jgi:hypothetical protein